MYLYYWGLDMKNYGFMLILTACLLSATSNANAQLDGGLILPMPGQSQTQKSNTSRPANTQVKTNTQNNYNNFGQRQNPNAPTQQNNNRSNYGNQPSNNPNQTIIPLPTTIKNTPQPSTPAKSEPSQTVEPASPENTPLITIPDSTPSQAVAAETPTEQKPVEQANNVINDDFGDNDFPVAPNEVTTSTDSKLEEILPPANEENTVISGTNGSMTIFPKDTGSAIFMVMKSWKCDDYDGSELLNHAVEVYGQEAADTFTVKDLETGATAGYTVTIEEEDITLDELLDILASKSGRDWGADIPNKTIYIYPKGIKTESYVSW